MLFVRSILNLRRTLFDGEYKLNQIYFAFIEKNNNQYKILNIKKEGCSFIKS